MNWFQKILQEVLEDRLMDTKLFEMAYDRKKALDILMSYHNTIADHFIKVALFPDNIDYDHWIFELHEIINKNVDSIRLKPKNRKLRYSDYYEWLFDGPLGHEGAVDQRLKGLIKSDRVPHTPKVNMEEVRIKLKYMYEELCDDLSIDNYEDIRKYTEMLK